jgi:hypothetical protein
LWLLSSVGLTGAALTAVSPAAASANPWPAVVVSGFSSPTGDGFWLLSENGAVTATGDARRYGDASSYPLHGPVLGGAGTPNGTGYWLVASDGGIFSYGSARFYGSMGGTRLNEPIFSMTPTRSGRGYWLVARDGGVFSFGDARFYGSTGNLRLYRPIIGVTTTPSGRGYRMIASDGGIFSFGDARFLGSVPALGLRVDDVVGAAATPTNNGYWIVRRGGEVYAFGDAAYFGNVRLSAGSHVVAIVSNPVAPGYRIVTDHGVTVAFGQAPSGSCTTAPGQPCTTQLMCRAQLRSPADYQAEFDTRGPLWDGADGGGAIDLGGGRRLWLFGDTFVGPARGSTLDPARGMVRNTVAVEQGNCFEFRVGAGAFPTDYLPAPGPHQWWWPLSGFVDAGARVVRVVAFHLTTAAGPPGWQWKILSTDILTLDLSTLRFRGSVPMPRRAGNVYWGRSIVATAQWIYLYGQDSHSKQYVARTTRAHLFDGDWQFNDGSGWSSDPSAAQPMEFVTADGQPDTPPTAAGTVEPYGGGYVFSTKRCDLLCDDVSAWYSLSPGGPWLAVNAGGGRIATTSVNPCEFTYGGRLVPTRGSWIVLWSVNCSETLVPKYSYGVRVAAPQTLPSPAQLAATFQQLQGR